ncbi:MAG: hypothetical protein Kow0089_06290 [Desulfobulbaceae bacterium]
MLKNFFLMIFGLSILFFISSLSVNAGEDKCARVFEMNCGECHEIERGCELFGQSKEKWLELFEFMEDMGADIPEDEMNLLSDCLVSPSRAVKDVCTR